MILLPNQNNFVAHRKSLSKYRDAGLPDNHHVVACTLGNIEMAENVLRSS